MNTLSRLWKVIVSPRQTALELVHDSSPRSALAVVLGLGICYAITFGISAWKHDFPPSQDVLKTWIEVYGEFGILPFVNIPTESYRLAEAIFIIPVTLASWILMAGSARLLSIRLGGKLTFEQYLNLFGFSFFAFWILAQLMDTLINSLGSAYMLPALRNEYGPLARSFFTYSFIVGWPLLLTLGGVYNGLVSHFTEKFAAWKAALVGMVTLPWPIVLVAFLVR